MSIFNLLVTCPLSSQKGHVRSSGSSGDLLDLICTAKSEFQTPASPSVSHEPQAFALLQTSADHDALKNPFNITRCFAEARIGKALTLVEKPDPRKFLIYATKSSGLLIFSAYKRFYETALRHRGLPMLTKLNFTAVNDILDLFSESSTTADLMKLTFKLRDEIKQLESPNATRGPQYYFAEPLCEHEKNCFEALKHKNPSCDLNLIPPKEPCAQACNNDDNEIRHTCILRRRVNPSPEPVTSLHETNVEEHATPLNQ